MKIASIDHEGRSYCVATFDIGQWFRVIANCKQCGDRVMRADFSKAAIEDAINGTELMAWRTMEEIGKHACEPDFTGEPRPLRP